MSDRPKILIAEPDRFSEQAIAELEAFSDVVVCETAQSDVREALCDYDAIWIRLGLQIRESDLQDDLRCRHILSATTGEDHVDLVAAQIILKIGFTDPRMIITHTSTLNRASLLIQILVDSS